MVYVSELMMMVGFYTRPQTHLEVLRIMRAIQMKGFQRGILCASHSTRSTMILGGSKETRWYLTCLREQWDWWITQYENESWDVWYNVICDSDMWYVTLTFGVNFGIMTQPPQLYEFFQAIDFMIRSKEILWNIGGWRFTTTLVYF